MNILSISLIIGFILALVYITYYDWIDGKVYIIPLIPLFILGYTYRLLQGDMLAPVISMTMLFTIFMSGVYLEALKWQG